MKRSWFVLLVVLPLLFVIFGCNQAGSVKDPPEFVEMYLDPDSAIPEDVGWPTSGELILLEETTGSETTDSTTVSVPPVYDGEVFSETDFEVVVVTNGENYDLLYSIELQDSLRGSCVYTNQSTEYFASSTIIVQNDGSYSTTVRLTIPATTAPVEYLSDRTISLTKILFTRDTVDGTFPADIPSNTTTSLLFQIHAREYFDPLIGLPLRINDDGFVDVFLTPDSSFYERAQTAAVGVVDLPATVNGYPIGKIFLQDLDWVTELHLAGATDDVFILGDFSDLQVLILSDCSFPVMTETRNITVNGIFPTLSLVELHRIDRFRFLLARNTITDDPDYVAFLTSNPSLVSEYPLLASVLIDECALIAFQIGKDAEDAAFPSLVSVSANESRIGDFDIGNEDNLFPSLETVSILNSTLSSLRINGTMPDEASGAAIILSATTVEFTALFGGSALGTLALNSSSLGGLEIGGGTIQTSKWTGITISGAEITETGPIWIRGSHPLWEAIDLHDLEAVSLHIGDVGADFASLTSIHLTEINCQNVIIGDRDASFDVLSEIVMTDLTVNAHVWISGENADFPLLETILVEGMNAQDLIIANSRDVFSSLETVTIRDSVFSDELIPAGGAELASLTGVIIEDVECVTFAVYNYDDPYELFLDNLVASINFSLGSGGACSKVWVALADVTTWDRYAYAQTEEIPVETWIKEP